MPPKKRRQPRKLIDTILSPIHYTLKNPIVIFNQSFPLHIPNIDQKQSENRASYATLSPKGVYQARKGKDMLSLVHESQRTMLALPQ